MANNQRDALAATRRISSFRSARGTGPFVLGRDILVGLHMLPIALMPPIENLGGDKDSGEGRGNDTHEESEGDVVELTAAEEEEREGRQECRRRGHDSAGKYFSDRTINDVTQRPGGIKLKLFTNTIEDNDRLVDRVTSDAQNSRDHRRRELVTEKHEDTDVHQNIVQG